MGAIYLMQCNSCGAEFEFSSGAGYGFTVLTCELCGGQETVSVSELGPEMFSRGPHDDPGGIKAAFIESLAARKHSRKCPGNLKADSSPRCPHCRSLDVRADSDGSLLFYD